MVVPLGARVVAAAAGGLLVLTAWTSVTGTLIVSRSVGGRQTRGVDRIVTGAFGLAAARIPDYERRDRLLATQPAGAEPAGASRAPTTRWDRACQRGHPDA
jgi:hypothetical protein